MSRRKPAGESRESFVDRQVREAQERGDFDDLAGAGRPLDLHRSRDDLWWVRGKLQDEGLSYLPPALEARKELERARGDVARARSEDEVRRILAARNARIRELNRAALQGPPSTAMPLDVDETISSWRGQRAGRDQPQD